MSLDNVIAIAGAAQNAHADQIGLVIFGLVISVPIIIWGSTLVLKLIDRFPLVVTFGAGLLGWIAGGMLVTDVFVVNQIGEQPQAVKITVEVIGALLVIVLGRWLASRKKTPPRNPLMSLRKTEDLQQSESGLSLLQGLFILAIIGVVATVIVSSSSDATTCPCHNVWSSPPREPACRLASRACAGQAARALPGVHGRTPSP